MVDKPISASASSSSLSPCASDPPKEYRLVLLGTRHKEPLFQKLRSAAQKWEQHIQYADICYLTFQFGAETVVVELIDPGTEKTGERQMAIQEKAHAVILCYAAYNPESFHTLEGVVEDFQTSREPKPTLLLCNEDPLVEEDGEESEGYGSSSGSPEVRESGAAERAAPGLSLRRRSMERISRAMEERCPITREEGEQLAALFGPHCEFRSLQFGSLDEPFVVDLVEHLVRRAIECGNSKASQKRSRSRANSRHRLSPVPFAGILRKSSLKSLLTHSKSDAQQQREKEKGKRLSHPQMVGGEQQQRCSTSATSSEAEADAERKSTASTEHRQSMLGNALRAITHPRQRAKSHNKVAAAMHDGADQDDLPSHPMADIEVHPPTGEPSAKPFSFEARVNNFVGEDREQQPRRASHITVNGEEKQTGRTKTFSGRTASVSAAATTNTDEGTATTAKGRANSHSSAACVIQ